MVHWQWVEWDISECRCAFCSAESRQVTCPAQMRSLKRMDCAESFQKQMTSPPRPALTETHSRERVAYFYFCAAITHRLWLNSFSCKMNIVFHFSISRNETAKQTSAQLVIQSPVFKYVSSRLNFSYLLNFTDPDWLRLTETLKH